MVQVSTFHPVRSAESSKRPWLTPEVAIVLSIDETAGLLPFRGPGKRRRGERIRANNHQGLGKRAGSIKERCDVRF